MFRLRMHLLGFVALAGVVVLAGCKTPQSTASTEQIPKITKLYEKATAVQVHRFRKPLRDERARILRMLSEECDTMIANMRGSEASAEALTGDVVEGDTTRTPTLERALAQIGVAAREGDMRALRSAHEAALSAYGR
ncbi:MAG: hypothetical protein JSU63_00695 [Phycisphaerales bacterium]|nr:MAG: hypothetical protein JSU63_00695 [Phycisphaerales bacterium]